MTRKICRCTTETCGCCEGIQILTPQPTANRPGLNTLNYRVGIHGAFLETMKARLTTMTMEVAAADGQTSETLLPLLDLTTRDSSDFSIGLLDSWATVADVLTFYQERIANEGFLRTATERRSILELARLIGYALRPGVAATVYLAYTIDENQTTPAQIPAGARSQSIPGPGELPQSFETSDPLEARPEWNNLQVRLMQPQTEQTIRQGQDQNPPTTRVYLKGITTNLQQNDALLIEFGTDNLELFRIIEVDPDADANRTLVKLQKWSNVTVTGGSGAVDGGSRSEIRIIGTKPVPSENVIKAGELLQPLLKSASLPPQSAARLVRDLKTSFAEQTDTGLQLLGAFQPTLTKLLPTALANAKVTRDSEIKVYALRAKAGLFGNNAPQKPKQLNRTTKVMETEEWVPETCIGPKN